MIDIKIFRSKKASEPVPSYPQLIKSWLRKRIGTFGTLLGPGHELESVPDIAPIIRTLQKKKPRLSRKL